MGRPPMALGTAGAIRIYKTTTGFRARVLVRDYDGRVRAVDRNAASRIAAERALKLALRDRAPGKAGGELAADSRVLLLAEPWYASLENLSPITMQAYRDRLDRQLLPRLGQLRIRELSVGILDRHLARHHRPARHRHRPHVPLRPFRHGRAGRPPRRAPPQPGQRSRPPQRPA